jgi:short-subunit dehydrogenase
MTATRTVLITGATGAIGAALAREYAETGTRLVLHGRRTDLLDEVANVCRARGADVETHGFDLCDTARTRQWVAEVDARHPIDLLFSNAGMNTSVGEDGSAEDWQAVSDLLDINVKASFALVHAALPGMRQRRSGQVVLMSSLAAYFGLPVTPTYSASKAALKAYGEALRGWLQPEGVRVNVVMPGYVDSAMCRAMPGPKPLLWLPDKAARVMRRQLAADKARISFPFPLSFGCWLLSIGHPATAIFILRQLDYRA